MVASVGTRLRICADVNRTGSSFSTRDTHNKNILTINLLDLNHTSGNYISAYLLAIVDHVPKILLQFLSINILRNKSTILLLAYTKQNNSTIGIGKSRIGLPERSRETTFSLLSLKLIMFSVFTEFV